MPAVSPRRQGRRSINEINMVPFIDVMLVLLIIFMVTATVITPGVINIPTAGQAEQAPPQRVDFLLDGQGRLSLSGEIEAENLNQEEALARIRNLLQETPDLPVMLAADRDLPYQQVVSLMKELKDAGVTRIGLSVK